jgi:carbon monoxide dehydrogenase subunit G
MTTNVDKSIEVAVPVGAVYNQWTQFEEFPEFMSGVESVTQVGDTRLHWVAEIFGVRREWDATILEQVPDEKIAWAATEGATNAGAVYFASVGAGRTLVRLALEFEPEGIVEKLGDVLNVVEKQAQGDLERFKAFIEARGSATGAWRGEVAGSPTLGTPGVEDAAASEGTSGKAGLSTVGKVVGAAAAAAAGVAAVSAVRGTSDSGDDDTAELSVPDVALEEPVTPVPDFVEVVESPEVVVTDASSTAGAIIEEPATPAGEFVEVVESPEVVVDDAEIVYDTSLPPTTEGGETDPEARGR